MSQPEEGRATSSLEGREVQQLLQAVNRRAPFGERDHAMLALALHLPSELGKGGREIIVPLNDVARRAVAVILDVDRHRGFCTATGRESACARGLARAGGPHTCDPVVTGGV